MKPVRFDFESVLLFVESSIDFKLLVKRMYIMSFVAHSFYSFHSKNMQFAGCALFAFVHCYYNDIIIFSFDIG